MNQYQDQWLAVLCSTSSIIRRIWAFEKRNPMGWPIPVNNRSCSFILVDSYQATYTDIIKQGLDILVVLDF